ncbi:psbP domain-containing protein 2, chloroplastic [Impatiens glandulifera]|uniref:psbP domain-containing protein 2, chloroplastic n=1 Tax=Impatiens glandulifera TaxID=253017 RepID=UPI001FB0965B|nr:psbP domain-containing protein 2, chloroplastic [Impatiens glandulifera]
MALSDFQFLVSSRPPKQLFRLNPSRRRFFSSVSYSCAAAAAISPTDDDEEPQERNVVHSIQLSKRNLYLAAAAIFSSVSVSEFSKAMAQDFDLQRYTDSTQGFTILKPSSWIQVEKAGATALFEEPNQGSNNIGIVVNPVRITRLEDFGSPEFVADKLIQAEKRKESTKDAQVIAYSERSGMEDIKVYEFEYKLDSTRGGMKRIFSAAFVSSKKLHLLNISHSDKPESPLDAYTRSLLEQVLHSFNPT